MRRFVAFFMIPWVLLVAACSGNPTPIPASPLPTATATGTATVLTPTPTEATPTEATPSEVPSSPAPTAATFATRRFVTPVPPPATATWTSIRWRRLAVDDPLALVQTVVRWRGGFVAVGAMQTTPTGSWTPLWRSSDGASWVPLGPVFGAHGVVLGVAQLGAGLAALTANGGNVLCASPDCGSLAAPIISWTSSDGLAWVAHVGPDLPVPAEGPLRVTLASGPGGLVAANVPNNGGTGAVATSVDGASWESLPPTTLPPNAAIRDLHATSTGFLGVAQTRPAVSDVTGSVALRSTDGRVWTSAALPVRTSTALVQRVYVSGGGSLAIGSDYGLPGTILWWWSADGRTWQPVKGYPPLGTCDPAICLGTQPAGGLGADGTRLVAYRGGADPGVWTSADGRTWSQLVVAGTALTTFFADGNLVVLPGGVLLTDGTTTWFGEATTR